MLPGPETMSGENELRTSGWTVDTLKGHYDANLAERDRRYQERFAAQEKAVLAALTAVKEASALAETERKAWQAANNEWRGAMVDRESRFMPRQEYESAHKALSDKFDDGAQRFAASLASIGSRLDLMSGRDAGANVEARLDAIAKQIDNNTGNILVGQGAKTGGVEARTAIYAAATFVVGLLSVVALVVSLLK